MTGTAFDEATRVDREPAGYVGTVRPEWDLVVPSGGITAGMAVRAIGRELDAEWAPASLQCRFVHPARHGPIVFDVTERHRGWRTRVLTAVASQRGSAVAECTVWVARPAGSGPAPVPEPVPAGPPPTGEPDEPGGERGATRWPFLDRVERSAPAGDGGAWVRLRRTPSSPDVWLAAARSVLFLDTCPFFALLRSRHPDGDRYVAQTLDLTTSFLGPFAPGEWLWLDADCDPAGTAVVAGRARLRDHRGVPVASGHQTLLCSRRGP